MHEQREICLIPIPFTDLSAIKKRPVIIISNNHYNTKTNDILVMAITSNLTIKDNSLVINSSDIETGILKG